MTTISESTGPNDAPPPKKWAILAVVSFVWLFAEGCGWIASGTAHQPDGFYASVLWGVVLGLPAFVVALVTLVSLARRLLLGQRSSATGILFSIGALLGGHLMHWTVYQMYLRHLYPYFFAHGRRLHRGRKILAPSAETGDGWLEMSTVASIFDRQGAPADSVRRGIARQWRENAAKEHASIAAFAHLTVDLLAVGAPARLVIAAQRAATDECRHAEISYSVAAAIDGRRASPAPFADAFARRSLASRREIALAQIAVDALADGALNEGLASRILARLAKVAASPELAAILSGLAMDEARHAKDSWDVIAWCADEGGETVARALEDARRAMPIALGSPLPAPARDGAWSPWGVQGVELEASEYVHVRRNADRRLGQVLARRSAA